MTATMAVRIQFMGSVTQVRATLGSNTGTGHAATSLRGATIAQERLPATCLNVDAREAQSSTTTSLGRRLGLVGVLSHAVAVDPDIPPGHADC